MSDDQMETDISELQHAVKQLISQLFTAQANIAALELAVIHLVKSQPDESREALRTSLLNHSQKVKGNDLPHLSELAKILPGFAARFV